MKIRNKVVGFVGPSGVGKTSFAIRLVRQHKFGLPLVATTRQRRADDDERYRYVSDATFLQMADNGIFLEWDKYSNYLFVIDYFRNGFVQGAHTDILALKLKKAKLCVNNFALAKD